MKILSGGMLPTPRLLRSGRENRPKPLPVSSPAFPSSRFSLIRFAANSICAQSSVRIRAAKLSIETWRSQFEYIVWIYIALSSYVNIDWS